MVFELNNKSASYKHSSCLSYSKAFFFRKLGVESVGNNNGNEIISCHLVIFKENLFLNMACVQFIIWLNLKGIELEILELKFIVKAF